MARPAFRPLAPQDLPAAQLAAWQQAVFFLASPAHMRAAGWKSVEDFVQLTHREHSLRLAAWERENPGA